MSEDGFSENEDFYEDEEGAPEVSDEEERMDEDPFDEEDHVDDDLGIEEFDYNEEKKKWREKVGKINPEHVKIMGYDELLIKQEKVIDKANDVLNVIIHFKTNFFIPISNPFFNFFLNTTLG